LKLSGSEALLFLKKKKQKDFFILGLGHFCGQKPKAKHHASLTYFSTGAFGKIAHS
jgi:hypothetical protein